MSIRYTPMDAMLSHRRRSAPPLEQKNMNLKAGYSAAQREYAGA